jgi:hypothetical protein
MSKDPLEYDPVVHGYSVAVMYQYDIASIKDVIKILKRINQVNVNEEYVKKFSKSLQLFDIFIRGKLNLEGRITKERLIKLGVIQNRK